MAQQCGTVIAAVAVHPRWLCLIYQALLVAIEHFISHWGDKRVRLAVAMSAQFQQSIHDRLGGSALLRPGRYVLCRKLADLCMRELRINKGLECCLKRRARGIDPPETVPAEYLQFIEKIYLYLGFPYYGDEYKVYKVMGLCRCACIYE